MKSLVALTLVLSFSTVSFAQEANQDFTQDFAQESIQATRPSRGWTCSATGRIATGGPGGGFNQTVWGRGSTMQNAASNALDTCFRQMQQCMLGSCGQY